MHSHPAIIDGVIRLIRKYEQLNQNTDETMQYRINGENQKNESNEIEHSNVFEYAG